MNGNVQTMKIKIFAFSTLVAAAALLGACASKRAAVTLPAKGGKPVVTTAQEAAPSVFLAQVLDNQVYAQNIVGNMSFNLKAGGKDITVPGSVHMRKNKVIRLQLFVPILGTEVGRLEFTPSYVLVIDRLHKEYIKADYTQVDFLQRNGITFYSLQALFWNQLFAPGRQTVADRDLSLFTLSGPAASAGSLTADASADAQAAKASVHTQTVKTSAGHMSYQWNADAQTGRILSARVVYAAAGHGQSTLDWSYADFRPVGVKQFPARQTFRFTTTATKQQQSAQVSIKMNDVKTTEKWDAETVVSSKYKKVEAADVLQKLLQM